MEDDLTLSVYGNRPQPFLINIQRLYIFDTGKNKYIFLLDTARITRIARTELGTAQPQLDFCICYGLQFQCPGQCYLKRSFPFLLIASLIIFKINVSNAQIVSSWEPQGFLTFFSNVLLQYSTLGKFKYNIHQELHLVSSTSHLFR